MLLRKPKKYVIYTNSPNFVGSYFSSLQKHIKNTSFSIYEPLDGDDSSPTSMALNDTSTPPNLKIIILEEKWGYMDRRSFIASCIRTMSDHSFNAHVFIASPKFVFFTNLHKLVGFNEATLKKDLSKFIVDYDLDNQEDDASQAICDIEEYKNSLNKVMTCFGSLQQGTCLEELKDDDLPFIMLPPLFHKLVA
jgi:hypothetical protein